MFSMVVVFITSIFLMMIILSILLNIFMYKSMILINVKMFDVGCFSDFEILVSIWNMMFLFMVLLISMSVIVFSFAYMNGLWVSNFMFLYVSFIISMVWLIMNNNFYWMMFGWDGLGVVSFMLIVFYLNYESVNNGLFTLFQNRIGDLFFIFFMVGVVDMVLTTNLILKVGLIFLILGSTVKSAQFPFNSWLLSAMSAPTPISSLVHSSTLVVAGVFILLQFSYCLSECLNVLKYISILSLILSTFGLLNETDMKKLIAYSTMNHVSLMMFLLSLKLFKITYFHLNVHAMFKSLMFMCFGFVMLVSYHGQDKRLVTVLMLNPLIKVIYYFSCMCLAGLPFMSAFFSKDLIIEKLMESSYEFFYIIGIFFFLGVSIFYSMMLMKLFSVQYVYSIFEKNYMSQWSVICMMSMMIFMVNVFLSLVFSLSLEMISFKFSIYFFIFVFFLMSLLMQFNFKANVFEKTKNIQEIWFMSVYKIDSYVYMHMIILMQYLSVSTMIKYIVLMNWWVVFIFVFIF